MSHISTESSARGGLHWKTIAKPCMSCQSVTSWWGKTNGSAPDTQRVPTPQTHRLQVLQDQMLQIPWDMMKDEYLICLFLALWAHALGWDHVRANCKRWHSECFAPRKEDIWWTINYLHHFAANGKNHRLILFVWLLPRFPECNNLATQFL